MTSKHSSPTPPLLALTSLDLFRARQSESWGALGVWVDEQSVRDLPPPAFVVPHPWESFDVLREDYELLRHHVLPSVEDWLRQSVRSILGVRASAHLVDVLLPAWAFMISPGLLGRIRAIESMDTLVKEYVLADAHVAPSTPPSLVHLGHLMFDDHFNDFILRRLLNPSAVTRPPSVSTAHVAQPTQTVEVSRRGALRRMTDVLAGQMLTVSQLNRLELHPSCGLSRQMSAVVQLGFGQIPRRQFHSRPTPYVPDPAMRARLGSTGERSSVEWYVSSLASILLPTSLLEQYERSSVPLGRTAPRYRRGPSVSLYGGDILVDDAIDSLAERVKADGGQVVGVQHGANYGQAALMIGEEVEIRSVTRWHSWGWRESRNSSSQVGWLPAPRLLRWNQGRTKFHKSGGECRVLVVLEDVPWYPNHFLSYSYGGGILEHLREVRTFVETLHRYPWADISLRLGRGTETADARSVSLVDPSGISRVVPRKGSLVRVARDYDLVILTYNSTAFAELVSANIPVSMLWDPGVSRWRETEISCLEGLLSARLLNATGSEAARFVIERHADLRDWWSSDRTSSALAVYKRRHAWTGRNRWLAPWILGRRLRRLYLDGQAKPKG
jgi:putative transferase (TIGR04331 family)